MGPHIRSVRLSLLTYHISSVALKFKIIDVYDVEETMLEKTWRLTSPEHDTLVDDSDIRARSSAAIQPTLMEALK